MYVQPITTCVTICDYHDEKKKRKKKRNSSQFITRIAPHPRNQQALEFHFVRWSIRQGTRKSKTSGGGRGFVRFSYFMYVTCCRLALFQTFMPCFRWFQIVCEWLQMFLRWLQVVVEIFEVVVGGCRWFQVVVGGFRSFLILVLTFKK